MKWEKIKAGLYQWDDYIIRKVDHCEWLVTYKDEAINSVTALWCAKEVAEKDFKKRLEEYNAFERWKHEKANSLTVPESC